MSKDCQDHRGPWPKRAQERNEQTQIKRTRRLMTKLAIFLFLHQLISSTKWEVIQCKESFYAWETMPSTWKTTFLLQSPRFHKQNLDPPSFTNEAQTSLFSPSFAWFHIHKTGAWLLSTCHLFLTFHKQIPPG
jgi:hypothetical protein